MDVWNDDEFGKPFLYSPCFVSHIRLSLRSIPASDLHIVAFPVSHTLRDVCTPTLHIVVFLVSHSP